MIDYGPLMLPHRNLSNSTRPLKIGLVLNSHSGPAWIGGVTDYLRGIPHFEVHSIVAGASRVSMPVAPAWLADQLYSASKRKYDPFAEVTLEAEEVQPNGLDMLVWLQNDAIPKGPIADPAAFEVFTIQLSDEHTHPPYWREVIERRPASSTVLYWHETTFERGRPVRIAETSTCRDWAFTRNAEAPLAAVARLIAEVGLELLKDREAWKRHSRECREIERQAGNGQAYPSALDTARFAIRQSVHSVRVRVNGRNGREARWFIAIRRQQSLFYSNLGRFSPSAIDDIPLEPAHMADPFVMSKAGKDWLFYEEIPKGSRRGRLMCTEIGASGPGSKPEIILEKNHHLSYPCVFTHGEDVFLMPETCEDRTVPLYRATRFPFEFQLEANLLEDVSAVDTTPFFLDGKWYFFTTTTEPFMESFLFWADSLDGRWNLHPVNPISSSVKNVRAAGHLFYHNGRLLRPTQDCSIRYGYGITINEIVRLTPAEFEERQVDFIAPSWRAGLLGTHTLNSNSTIEVMDGIRYQ